MGKTWWQAAAVLAAAVGAVPAARADFFGQTNLVSDGSVPAANTDSNLKNPWGISESARSPFWVSDQFSGVTTLYNSSGAHLATFTVPSASGAGPTGQVNNTSTDFKLSNGNPAAFLFANLDGTISGWNGGTTAQVVVPAVAGSNVSYTGLAMSNVAAPSNLLYAADDGNGKIDVFNTAFTKVTTPGGFVDPNLPAGFHTFNIQNLGGVLYVTYENGTLGGGVVDKFDLSGHLIGRVSANGPGGPLESPWGVAIAPAGFGTLGGDLLVGNEDDGHISIFDKSGNFIGFIMGTDGKPITNLGLWGLQFGNGGNGGDPNTLYFAAGLAGETHGLLGAITAVPEPGSIVLFGLGGLALVLAPRFRSLCRSTAS
jgi:uncharacterized protein (TIGR03118 family)